MALGFPAYHGSPHDFDKFSLHKIGTGEGAQAYGWGLYFAGEKAVADYYKNALAKPPTVYVDGVEISRLTVDEVFARSKDPLKTVAARISNLAKAKHGLGHSDSTDAMALVRAVKDEIWGGLGVNSAMWQESIDRKDTAEHIASNRRVVKSLEDQLRVVQDLLKREVTIRFTGGTYKVEIPEPHMLLEWDAPVSEQSGDVQGALRRLPDALVLKMTGGYSAKIPGRTKHAPTKGSDVYSMLEEALGTARGASEALLAAGIPGLRYYDAASRGDGKGSYNYVIWDDRRVEVKEKFHGLGSAARWMRTPGGR